jgi:dTDP-4-amino-4,6-dideoxygalactose transaminase
MTDIQAAVGREQLKRLPQIVAGRRAIAARYMSLLADIPGLTLPQEPEWARSNWQSFCVRLPEHIDQRTVMQAMLDDGVATRRGIMCSHRESVYAGLTPPDRLAHSEAAQDHCVVLPLYVQMSQADIERVADSLRKVCLKAPSAASGEP